MPENHGSAQRRLDARNPAYNNDLQPPRVTVAVPTLTADGPLWEAIESLRSQTYRNLHIVIVDNSGSERVARNWPPGLAREGVKVLHPGTNTGYGAAVNLAHRDSPADYVAVLNDDAVAAPEWIAAMVEALERRPAMGSAAAQVRLFDNPAKLDSAGMRIAADGTSKQRGHGSPCADYGTEEEVLLASGSAAMYRAAMLEDTGGFDDRYFLYCEDTDLGLRARWAGWGCVYVPSAKVTHRYSHSAGRASKLKAYYVERNRLRTIVKNFPFGPLVHSPFATYERYWHHLEAMRGGSGAAAQFTKGGSSAVYLIWCVVRAHLSLLWSLPALLRQRRAIRREARIGPEQFMKALEEYSISVREVAWL